MSNYAPNPLTFKVSDPTVDPLAGQPIVSYCSLGKQLFHKGSRIPPEVWPAYGRPDDLRVAAMHVKHARMSCRSTIITVIRWWSRSTTAAFSGPYTTLSL